ncbi:MAG: hypothetical protein PQJ61_16435 [Spirochaetales bacterium]|uniref:Uncharacterized protein n=1 Tax=Candidatus Thalassospirochaeta sargassi TaxID=3119039 RepID=A0AAJ1IFF9_9SPIO|nr:hypothetical protein [Spirochaetales bacterium]
MHDLSVKSEVYTEAPNVENTDFTSSGNESSAGVSLYIDESGLNFY